MAFYSNISGTNSEKTVIGATSSTTVNISVAYRDTSTATSMSKQVVGASLKTDLTEGYAEQIVSGSVRVKLGDSVYVDRMGSIYKDPSSTTGAGTLAGQVHYGNGSIEFSSWIPDKDNNPILESLATQIENIAVSAISFRAPITPLRPQSLTITATKKSGGNISITPDASGVVETSEVSGEFNWQYGLGQFVFRQKTKITTANRAEIEAQDWYLVEMEYNVGSDIYINEPIWVLPETIKFSAVGYTYIPLDAELLGLDPVRLPSDGRVPIFRKGEVVVIHNTKTDEVQNPTALATFNVGRTRLSYIKLYDSAGTVVDPNTYTTNPDLGDVTLLSNFTTLGLVLPIVAEHRIEDAAMCTDVQINGELTLNVPISHAYTSGQTFVSSAMMLGDIQARVHTIFSQNSWQSNWLDEREGSAISAQYNSALFPIEITNQGALQERWALIFTAPTVYRLVGEKSGVIGEGISISSDYSPLNPITNAPYFKIKAAGFGTGWAAGNVIRLNTAGATYPFW
ncbi:MAG: hypothetical protein RSC68_19675, partial [Acinetobacter sp.]